MQHYQAHRRQIRLQVGKLMNLINFGFYVKLMKNGMLLNNSIIQHHFEAFITESKFSHATLPGAPSLDEIIRWETDKHYKLRLLRETVEKWYLIKQLKNSATFQSKSGNR